MLLFEFLLPGSSTPTLPVQPQRAWLINGSGQVVPSRMGVRREGALVQILCEKGDSEPAALCIPMAASLSTHPSVASKAVPMGDMLVEQTPLLPQRDRPYALWAELARRRLMACILKLEEWGLFGDPSAAGLQSAFDEARALFTDALVARPRGAITAQSESLGLGALQASTRACAMLADTMIERGLDRLAARAADAVEQDARPNTGGDPSRPTNGPIAPCSIGCSVHPAVFSESLARSLERSVDFVHVATPWSVLEPKEGRYSFRPTDQWIEWAVVRGKKPLAAGPIIDLRPAHTPEWLSIWENDFDSLREMIYEHARQVVTRYRRTVPRWIATSSVQTNSSLRLSYDRMIELTRLVVLTVRKLHPKAEVGVDIARPWGEYVGVNRDAIAPMVYAQLLLQSNVRPDFFGVRIQAGGDVETGPLCRDEVAIAELLSVIGELERPIHVTCLGAPGNAGNGLWSAAHQSRWMERVALLCAAQPMVRSICWQELADTTQPLEMVGGGLVDAAGLAKPALERWSLVRARLSSASAANDRRPVVAGPGGVVGGL